MANDCKRKTLSAFSYPSRRMVQHLAAHASKLHEAKKTWVPYRPTAEQAQHNTPDDWRHILALLQQKAMKDLKAILETDTLSLGIHIDGETDRFSLSSAVVTVKLTQKSTGTSQYYCAQPHCQPERRSAEG